MTVFCYVINFGCKILVLRMRENMREDKKWGGQERLWEAQKSQESLENRYMREKIECKKINDSGDQQVGR